VSWRDDNAEGESWPDKTAERRAVAVERVKNGHMRGYLAYHDNKIVGGATPIPNQTVKRLLSI